MAKRELKKNIDGVDFLIYYTPSNDMMEQLSVNKGDFELHILGATEDDPDDELKDVNKFKEWHNIAIEGKVLLDHLVNDDYKAFIKEFGVNPLSLDVVFFRLSVEYYNNKDDQRFEIESTKAINMTVKGRKYLEKING